jgi:hypothetical protein
MLEPVTAPDEANVPPFTVPELFIVVELRVVIFPVGVVNEVVADNVGVVMEVEAVIDGAVTADVP